MSAYAETETETKAESLVRQNLNNIDSRLKNLSDSIERLIDRLDPISCRADPECHDKCPDKCPDIAQHSAHVNELAGFANRIIALNDHIDDTLQRIEL